MTAFTLERPSYGVSPVRFRLQNFEVPPDAEKLVGDPEQIIFQEPAPNIVASFEDSSTVDEPVTLAVAEDITMAIDASHNFTRVAAVLLLIALVAVVVDRTNSPSPIPSMPIIMLIVAAIGFFVTGAVARRDLRRVRSA